MKSLYDKRQQWAARCTWQHLTLGAHFTQRSESVHSCIKQFLNSHTLLTQLATKIDENRQTISCQNEGRAIRLALKLGYDSSTRYSIEKNLKTLGFVRDQEFKICMCILTKGVILISVRKLFYATLCRNCAALVVTWDEFEIKSIKFVNW